MRKMVSMILAGLLLLGSLAGCTSDGETSQGGDVSKTNSSLQESSKEESSQTEESEEFSYPMDGDVTISVNMEGYDPADIPDYAKGNYFWERIQEETGIHLEFIGAAAAAADTTQEFLLLLASGEYPDMFMCNWVAFPGGPTAALADGYIQTLDQYTKWMPNLSAYLTENPDIDRMIRNDNGELYATPWLREKGTEVGAGLVIRQDWLDELKLEKPTTIDELHDVLAAFKTEYDLASPPDI